MVLVPFRQPAPAFAGQKDGTHAAALSLQDVRRPNENYNHRNDGGRAGPAGRES